MRSVKGDVIVRNGKLEIEGEVQGDVTVINGEKYLASAGHVTGQIEEVNEVFDWIWYHMKKTAKDVIQIFDDKGNQIIKTNHSDWVICFFNVRYI